MPITYPYIQYGGVWTTSQATDAVASGTWAVPPAPYLTTWGYNAIGQLATGNLTYYSSPKQVGALNTWATVNIGGNSLAAIKTDGTLWVSGNNGQGQLGLGNTTRYSSPVQVGALTNWLNAANGGNHILTIKTDGTLWSWGSGGSGRLGLGNTNYYSSPKQIGALTTWSKIMSGGNFSMAIKTDGTLWAWGANQAGQLGLGNTTYYSSPKQVGSLTNWASIYGSSGGYAVFGIKTNGTLWAWGNGAVGQLGLGNTTYYSSPVQVGALTNWVQIASGSGYFALAVKTDGTLWSWGFGSSGRTAQGNTTTYSSPKQVGILTNWSYVSAGAGFGNAIKTDGTLWSWGQNGNGQLGLGNTTYYSSPKQVGTGTTWYKVSSAGSSVATLYKH
jgi:alpha-tubulin suppressor-like RCC1 family protein